MGDAWGGSWGTSWGLSWTRTVAPQPDQDVTLGGGTYQFWKKRLGYDEDKGKRWEQRRRQLEKISRLIDGIAEEIPADVPEAQVARQAAEDFEKAADKLAEDVPVQFFDWAGLAREIQRAQAALKQAEVALAQYQARVEEEDDEDALLMMG